MKTAVQVEPSRSKLCLTKRVSDRIICVSMRKSREFCLVAMPALLLVGCGGTNTTDGTAPFNRANGSVDPNATPLAAPGQEILGTYALVSAPVIADSKQATAWVDKIKKLQTPPKKIFMYGANSALATKLKKPLDEAKIGVIPVPDIKLGDDWSKTVKAFGADKFFGNGPTEKEPNIDLLTSDQSKWSSIFNLDGVRFVLLNTDTPTKANKNGEVPRLWMISKLKDAKNIVVLGAKPLRAPEGQSGISTNDPFAKSPVRLYAFAGGSPTVERPDEKSIYQMSVPASEGLDKPLIIGMIEIRKSGAIQSRIVQLNNDLTAKNIQELTLFEPAPKIAEKPAEKTPEKPADKSGEKEPPKPPAKTDKG